MKNRIRFTLLIVLFLIPGILINMLMAEACLCRISCLNKAEYNEYIGLYHAYCAGSKCKGFMLEEGNIIGIFPQGTRTRRKDGKPVTVKRGAVAIAIKADVPILPVAIQGSYKLFSRVKVIFGRPYKFDIEKDKKYSSEEMNEMAKDIMGRVYGLLEEK